MTTLLKMQCFCNDPWPARGAIFSCFHGNSTGYHGNSMGYHGNIIIIIIDPLPII